MEISELVDVEYDSVKITTARLPKRTKILVRISDDSAAALAGIETRIVGSGDRIEYVKKIRTYDKLKALGDLGKHLGFFKEDNSQQNLPVFITHDPGGEERED
jgi:hypothetical protein